MFCSHQKGKYVRNHCKSKIDNINPQCIHILSIMCSSDHPISTKRYTKTRKGTEKSNKDDQENGIASIQGETPKAKTLQLKKETTDR